MSTRYSFKVHSLELARGLNGRKRLYPAISQNDDELKAIKDGKTAPAARDYLNDLVEVLKDLRDSEEVCDDVPKLMAVADGANEHVASTDPGTPRLIVESVDVTARRVSVVVEYGHLGYSHRAVGKTKKDDAKLDDKSPVEYFRVEFLVPDEGTTGIVVAEAVSRGSALPSLTAWINHKMREKFGDEGLPRLMTPALADKQKLAELVKGHTVAEIKLVRKATATDNLPDGGTIELVEKVRTGSKILNAQALAQSWWEKDSPYSEEERLQQIELLAELVDGNAAAMGFTDGKVRLDPGNGRMVDVSPSRVGEVFLYPISNLRPSTTVWEQRTKPQALAMAKAGNMSVAWD